MRKEYGSDISREQFHKIVPILESARKKPRPRQVDLYEVFCAILYLLKSGCQRAMLPSDFPAKSTVYHYYKWWKAKAAEGSPSLLEQALKMGLARSVHNRGGAPARRSSSWTRRA